MSLMLIQTVKLILESDMSLEKKHMKFGLLVLTTYKECDNNNRGLAKV